MSTYKYDDLAINLATKIDARLNEISVDYNFDLGDEFEIAICELLRSFLPNKYGVCRGFVVTENGDKAGDDIIIYDQFRFPTLKHHSKEDWARKENIPIEAVYGYIEAKHTLEISGNRDSNLVKALTQIGNVKELINQRSKYELDKNDPYHVGKGLKKIPDGIPPFRNPVFTLILSRFVSIKGERCELDEKIKELLDEFIGRTDLTLHHPEGIVVGNNNYITTTIKRQLKHPTNFIIPDDKNEYMLIQKNSLAMALGLIHMYSAIDWIRLDKMPWEEIFNDLKNN